MKRILAILGLALTMCQPVWAGKTVFTIDEQNPNNSTIITDNYMNSTNHAIPTGEEL